MRILHVVHQYPPAHMGGTELYARTVAQSAAELGHTVTVFARSAGRGAGDRTDQEGAVTVVRAWDGDLSPTRRYAASFGRGPLLGAFARTLAAVMPQVVHVQHGMGLPMALIDLLLAADIPYVVTLHDYWWVCANAQLVTNYDNRICHGPERYVNCMRCAVARGGAGAWPLAPVLWGSLAWRGRRLHRGLNRAYALLASTPFVADWYAAHGASQERILTLPLGIDPPADFRRDRQPQLPLRLGLLGGLVRQKGSHVVVDAAAALAGRVELWIAGDDGPDTAYADALRQSATSNVRLLGRLDRAGVWDMLAELDALLVPSLWYETYSYALHEALAAGVPVMASDLGVMAGAVDDGVNGRLVAPGTVADWVAALTEWADKPEILARLAAGIRRPPTVAEHMRQLVAVYAAAAEQQPR